MTAATRGSARITAAFDAARADGRIAFVPYVVGGYPDVATAERAALAAIDSGADVLEVGLPYSDPLADGATLQRASAAALAGGIDLAGSLALVKRICAARPAKPVLVMGYANQFMGPIGAEVISRRLADAGAAGAIVADLTPDEGAPLEQAFEGHGLALVYLVSPTTTPERAAWIASRGGGFVYCVSLTGVTGARQAVPTQLRALVARVRSASPLPIAVGFGVSRPTHVRAVARAGADGVIVGSALVEALGPDGRDVDRLAHVCGTLRQATTVPGAHHVQRTD
ncbi:tryptophan synthase subunit alpha [soil metagenome]